MVSLSIHWCRFFVIMSITGGNVSLVWQCVLIYRRPFILLIRACFWVYWKMCCCVSWCSWHSGHKSVVSSCWLVFRFLFITCSLCFVGLHPWMPFRIWTLSFGVLCLQMSVLCAVQMMLWKVLSDHAYLFWRYFCRLLSYNWCLMHCLMFFLWVDCFVWTLLLWFGVS